MSRAQDIARCLHERHLQRAHHRAADWPATADLELAYEAQEALLALREGGVPVIAGYKIGLTTPRMQAMCGIGHPIAGAVLAHDVHHSPARVRRDDFVRLGVESELAVEIAKPLGAGLGAGDLLAGISRVAAAFELIEDRNADYRTLDVRTLIAENSWNGGIVLGPPVAASDPADWDGELQIDSQFVDRGNSRDVLGNPLAAVAWLAGHLAARGQALKPRQWVMTGSIVPTRFAKRDEHYRFSVGSLPPVELRID